MEEQKNQSIHLAYLDGLRALAALYVVVHHSIKQYDHLIEAGPNYIKVLTKPFVYGHYAVNLFIVLSGFCLMLPILRNDGHLRGSALLFFKKRAIRILPPYYFAMALSLLLIFTVIGDKTNTHWDNTIPVTTWDIISHLFLIQDIFIDTAVKINHAFWSISVEWRIYLLFPILIILFRKIGALSTTIIITFISILLWVGLSATSLNLKNYGINPQYLGLFCLGMLSAYVAFSEEMKAKQLKALLGWKNLVLVFMCSFLLFLLGAFLVGNGIVRDVFPIRDLIFGLFTYIFLARIALGKHEVFRKALSWQPLVFIGTFAYSIYLIHAPLIQVIWLFVLVPLNFPLISSICFLIIVGTLLIICGSYLFFLLAEQPFLNKKGQKKQKVKLVIKVEQQI